MLTGHLSYDVVYFSVQAGLAVWSLLQGCIIGQNVPRLMNHH